MLGCMARIILAQLLPCLSNTYVQHMCRQTEFVSTGIQLQRLGTRHTHVHMDGCMDEGVNCMTVCETAGARSRDDH